MNDSPDNREERDTSQTKTPTPNGVDFGRRRFIFLLGGGLVLSQVSCSPTQVSIVRSDGAQAQGAETASPISLPEGAICLPVTTEDGTPVGILRQGDKIIFCIGEDMCEVRNFGQNGRYVGLNDQVLPDTAAIDMIEKIGFSEDDDLIIESSLGSLSIDTDAQQKVANELQKAIKSMRRQGQTEGGITVDDVSYELHLSDSGKALHFCAKLVGGDPPPTEGTCSITVSVLPKEKGQAGTAQ